MNPARAIFVILLTVLIVQPARAAFPDLNELPTQTNLPDALTMNNGSRVTTPEQWLKRRAQMEAILEYYELGHAPPPPGNVVGRDIRAGDLQHGTVKYRLVHLSFGPRHQLGFDVAIFTPAGSGPFPVIINPAFFRTPGLDATNPPALALTHCPGYAEALSRGYALVTYHYTECGEDNSNFLASAFYPAYPGYDWGELMGWAWGLSRVVDYVETQPFADKSKLIALGHSRLGKAVVIAAALDDRISLSAPAGSGCAGTGAYRFCGPKRGGKEGIENITRLAPYWFTPRFKEFAHHVYKLPFDQNWLLALTAPRPLISTEATEDQYCAAIAVEQTLLAAKPVYVFLGASPERLGIAFEKHRHALTDQDWNDILDFADQQLRGINHHRRFDQMPSAGAAGTAGKRFGHSQI